MLTMVREVPAPVRWDTFYVTLNGIRFAGYRIGQLWLFRAHMTRLSAQEAVEFEYWLKRELDMWEISYEAAHVCTY